MKIKSKKKILFLFVPSSLIRGCLLVAFSLSVIIVPVVVAAPSDPIARIWAVDDSEKVKQNDLTNPLATDFANNKVWNGSKVSIFGGKNEIVAFQLILEGGSAGASSVDVKLPSLANGSYTIQNDPISAGDPFDYRGKRIEMFVENYVNISRRSSLFENWWPNARPLPDSEFLGMTPDALIPFQVPSAKGGAPFTIASRKNQGVWVDIYIPKNAPPGLYAGAIQIKIGNSVVSDIPIELRVHNFTIPDESHLNNFFYGSATGEGLTEKHRTSFNLSESNYKLLEGRYFQMAHRHRFDLTFNTDLSGMSAHYKRYVTGEYYAWQNAYDGPGSGAPHTTYSIGTYQSVLTPDTQAGWQQQSDAWVNWFEQNAPKTSFFKYLYDEPSPSLYPSIQARAEWIHGNPGPGKRLKMFDTVLMDPRLFGYVDFWGLTGQSGYSDTNPQYSAGGKMGYQVVLTSQRRALGELAGIYNGVRPSYGAGFIIDTPGSEFRVTPWIMWKYNVDQYFLWQTMIWDYYDGTSRNTFQVPHYDSTNSSYGNGNGYFFYPGEQKNYSGTSDDKGLFGPIASMRMKNWRRGAQDYEYLWLAKQRGLNTSSIVSSVVPRAFDDYGPVPGQINFTSQNQQATWAQRGYSYENARLQLAQLLDGGIPTPTPTPTPPPSFSKCDQNHDTSTNVLDLQSLANVILGKTACSFTCDLNQDSSINVLDLQYLANVILGKSGCP